MASNFMRYMINIANIPWTVSRYELALYFSQFGYVQEANVVFNKETGLNQGFGHIVYLKKENVDAMLNREHVLEGRNLVISMKKPEESGNDISN